MCTTRLNIIERGFMDIIVERELITSCEEVCINFCYTNETDNKSCIIRVPIDGYRAKVAMKKHQIEFLISYLMKYIAYVDSVENKPDYQEQRGIEVPVETNPTRE